MSFLNIRFPEGISFGSSYGPSWNTTVIRINSGYEQRNQKWSQSMYKGDVAYGVRSLEDMYSLIEFFHEARGRAYSFRFKDWADYTATNAELVLDGTNTVQLVKKYGDNSVNDWLRTITKPLAGITMELNGSAFTDFTLDTDTGIVTFDDAAFPAVTATNISAESSPIFEFSFFGYGDGTVVYVSGIPPLNEFAILNDRFFVINKLFGSRFSLESALDGESFDCTGFTDTATADVQVFPQPSNVTAAATVTWSGSFDNHVRFDTDELSASWDDYDNLSTQVEVVEVRG